MSAQSPTADFLTISQVSTALSLSAPAVYRLVASGELPAHRFGGALRVSRKELDAYVERCRVRFRGRKKQDYSYLEETVH